MQEAWNVLSDETKRANYDKIVLGNFSLSSNEFLVDDNAVVNEVFPFSEFSSYQGSSYVHPCRCGGVFEVLVSHLLQ